MAFATHGSSPRRSNNCLVGISTCVSLILLVFASQAGAQALPGTDVRALALQGTWSANASGFGYWTWSDDQTVCLRLFDPGADCSDTGTWKIEADAICYELEWWGEGEGQRSLCLHVIALGGGQYEAQYLGEKTSSTVFRFEVLGE